MFHRHVPATPATLAMPDTSLNAITARFSAKRGALMRWLLAANLVVAALLAALVWSVVTSSRESYTTRARETAESLVAIAQLNLAGEANLVDAVLRATAEELLRDRASGDSGDAAITRVLNQRKSLLTHAEALRLTDERGDVRWGDGLPTGPPMSVADREFFQRALHHGEDRSLVSGPLRSRISGHWIVVFARPVREQGELLGVLYASMAVERFHELFARYELGQGDAITLRTADLRLIARRAPGSTNQGEVGSTAVSAESRVALAKSRTAGTFVSRVVIDGVERTTAYRAVEGWPFIVFAGLNNQRFFSPWAEQATRVALLAGAAWLLILSATAAVYRASRREAGAVQSLAAQTRRTRTLLRSAVDGIHIVDGQGRLTDMSDSFAEMLGATREQLLGRHISSWDVDADEARVSAWLATLKDGDRQRIDVKHRREDGTVMEVELQLRVADIDGERLIFASSRDVTEMRRLMREQAAMLDSDLVGMAKLEGRQIRWGNVALSDMLGYAPGELDGRSTETLYADEDTFRRVGEEAYPVLRGGGRYRAQVRMRRKQGDVIWVDLNGVQLTDTVSFWMTVDITAMKQAHDQLAHVAFHDALTQLPNRLLLSDRLDRALALARRSRQQVAVAFMDLDGFKSVNDRLGHEAGDALLIEVAQRLLASIRPGDTAARLGGDEFVLVLAPVDGDEWRSIIDRVRAAVQRPISLGGAEPETVGVSVGVALYPMDGERPAELLDRADQAMLAAKRAGRGRVMTLTPR